MRPSWCVRAGLVYGALSDWDETAGLSGELGYPHALEGARRRPAMKKHSKVTTRGSVKPELTVGLDLGDKSSHYCIVNSAGELMEEAKERSTEAGFRTLFGDEPRMRVGLETGTHSAWVDRLLTELGHEVIVANSRKVRAITANESKNDRNDAEILARLASCDPKLLFPIRHRGVDKQQDLNLIRTRA